MDICSKEKEVRGIMEKSMERLIQIQLAMMVAAEQGIPPRRQSRQHGPRFPWDCPQDHLFHPLGFVPWDQTGQRGLRRTGWQTL
jgi:hypothetical protein